jgi:hypothetical protein
MRSQLAGLLTPCHRVRTAVSLEYVVGISMVSNGESQVRDLLLSARGEQELPSPRELARLGLIRSNHPLLSPVQIRKSSSGHFSSTTRVALRSIPRAWRSLLSISDMFHANAHNVLCTRMVMRSTVLTGVLLSWGGGHWQTATACWTEMRWSK